MNGPKRPATTTSPLVRTEGIAPPGPLPSREIQELWFATQHRPWRTLVLIPTSTETSIWPLASALAKFGSFHRRRPVRILSAEGMGLKEIADLTMELEFGSQDAAAAPSVVVLEPITINPLGTVLALAADAVVLCVDYGSSTLDVARKTIEQVGRERFIGCVALKPAAGK